MSALLLVIVTRNKHAKMCASLQKIRFRFDVSIRRCRRAVVSFVTAPPPAATVPVPLANVCALVFSELWLNKK